MNDRELLELAAKAAGINLNNIYGCDILRNFSEPDHPVWNPLVDDGDALRLAVKLGIQIDPRDPSTRVFGPVGEMIDEHHKQNPYAATRRAIVRASAEIGAKNEPKHQQEGSAVRVAG